MALAGNISVRSVTGKFLDFAGNPIAGTVTFTIPQALIDAAAPQIIIPSTAVATLDAAGAFSVNLPVTDDVDLSPLNYLYTVVESFSGGRTYKISIPTGGGAIDLSAVAPASTFTLVYLLASAALWALLVNRVAVTESHIAVAPAAPTVDGYTVAQLADAASKAAYVPSPLMLIGA